jgi:rhodanese-related sulfurtransferase
MFTRNVRLAVALLLVLASLCAAWAWHRRFMPNHAAQAGLEMVGWEEAEPRVFSGEWILVDARSEKKFLHSHLPGAYSLPADAPADYLRFAAAEWPRQAVVVTYCGSTSCSLAVELAMRLREEAGREGVRVLTGNYFKDLYQTGRDAGTRSAQDREEESAH